ncbi:MAG: 2-(1,2-epoxy-1,2-dihydrophenyl)acetyl-CoA isomerase [Saprospiraceae bacterium]|jgi:2-(1,2-epoxy-1,2-dihydrophenyl)acetyl-CoA isomerase|nr:2-(1,2-epoxy-1,2-dihydrophenyl)acetyl-CoA isomerase [Saprospiraceae bacterium]
MANLTHQINNGVYTIFLNRPEVFNSFNRSMALDLQSALDLAEENPDIRCIVITGTGKAFSAGQDLGEVTGENPPSFNTILGEHYNPIISRIRSIEKPVIAAVNGVAAGAGANIALCCDIVLASKSASFIQAFSKIGLIPDSGGTFFLPRLIGFQKASALMMTGEKISATEAERLGMIYKVFDDENFNQEVEKLALQMANMPTRGLGLTKKALNRSFFNDLESQLQIEDDLQFQAGSTQDYQEGVNAFIEKRKPEFKGK